MSRKSFTTVMLTGVFLGWWVSPASAENIEEAWSTALTVDQRLQASREEVQSARCSHAAARAGYLPSITNKTAYTFLTDTPSWVFAGNSFPIVEDDFAVNSTMAKQPIYTWGRISNAVDAASCRVNATTWNVKRTILDVKLQVATAYTAVFRAGRAVEVAQNNTASLAAHQRVVEKMLQQGNVPRNDLLAAQVALADARQQEIQARNRLATARASYNRLLGRPLSQAVELDDLEVGPPSGDPESLTVRAIAMRPQLAALSSQANALRYQAESARAATRPQFGVDGGLLYFESPSMSPNTMGVLMFGLEWTPYDGGASRSKSNALLHDANAMLRLRADMVSIITLQVQNTWLDEQETRKRIEVTAKAIDQAEENLRAAKIRFEKGAAINTEVLDAETLRARTYSNYYNAVYDAVLSTFRMGRVVGDL